MKKTDLFLFVFFLKMLLLLFRLKSVLMMLFAFEFLIVKLLFSFVYLGTPFDPISMLVFLAVAAGEASMGLSLLMSLLRQKGKDKLKSLQFTKEYEGF